MVLADPLTHRDHDSLPADHRSQAERDRDRDLHPAGNELRRLVDVLSVVSSGRRQPPTSWAGGLVHQPERFADQVHVVAEVPGLRRGTCFSSL